MQTLKHIYMLQDFNTAKRKSFIKQSLVRRLRFTWHYWSQGYGVKTAWLLAGGR